MTIESTCDRDLIRQIILHPKVFHFRSLADGITPENFALPAGLYLLARDETGPLGVFYLHAQNPRLWQVHVAFLPKAWGHKTVRAGQAGLAWLQAETGCRKLLALIPGFNDVALDYVERIGGIRCGTIPEATEQAGVLYDEYAYVVEVKA
jgi:hypothetical protein